MVLRLKLCVFGYSRLYWRKMPIVHGFIFVQDKHKPAINVCYYHKKNTIMYLFVNILVVKFNMKYFLEELYL